MEKYTIGLYEKAMPGTLSWQEKLEAAKKAGFDYIEISIDETDEKLARLDMPKAETERKSMIEIKSLTKKYEEDSVLRDINIQIPDGCIFGIIGQSGAGKSSASGRSRCSPQIP